MSPPSWTRLRRDLQALHGAALAAADPAAALFHSLEFQGDAVRIADDYVPLASDSRLRLIAIGKAAPRMARAALERLDGRVESAVVAHPHGAELNGSFPGSVTGVAAGHPLPDAGSLLAGDEILSLVSDLRPEDLVLVLVSGGGSALAEALHPGITLDDVRAVTESLQLAGADIVELNTVRRALSRLKGGGLARAAAPARVATLVLSDVVGDRLDSIASGPTVDSPTTAGDALAILQRRGVGSQAVLEALRVAEPAPAGLPGKRWIHIVGSNRLAAQAACAEARRLGFQSLLLTDRMQGEAREVGRFIGLLARGLGESSLPVGRPACLVLGGETTVTVRGSGRGGRNLELALGAAISIAGSPKTAVFSFATDGIDGTSDAAGAVATGETLARAASHDRSAEAALAANDSHGFFAALDDLWVTGPSGTNVNDLAIALAY